HNGREHCFHGGIPSSCNHHCLIQNQMLSDPKTALHKLIGYCQADDWAGHDPYDALNSKLLDVFPFLNTRFPRLALTQLLKRSPVNIRGLLGIPKTQNPKAISLFLSAFLKMPESDLPEREKLIEYMIQRLIALRSVGSQYWCWGYSFPWQ